MWLDSPWSVFLFPGGVPCPGCKALYHAGLCWVPPVYPGKTAEEIWRRDCTATGEFLRNKYLSHLNTWISFFFFFFSEIPKFAHKKLSHWLHLSMKMGDCFYFSGYEGSGNPLQCCCLGNPMDRGAWWAAVYCVTKSSVWQSSWAQHSIPTVCFLKFPILSKNFMLTLHSVLFYLLMFILV